MFHVTILIGIVASLFCLFVVGFFSAAETALVSLSAQKAKRLALQDPSLIAPLKGWLDRPHELLTMILVGNTLATVMFASVITGLGVAVFRTMSVSLVQWVTWGLESIVVVIIGDIAPKFFARANPEKTSLLVLPWLSRFRDLFAPFMASLSFLGFLIPKLKSPPVGDMLAFSLEEFKNIIEETQTELGTSGDSFSMMHRVLDISDRKAVDIMTPMDKVDLIEVDPPGKSRRESDLLLDLAIEGGHTRTPVKQQGEIVGFIHSNDLLPLVFKNMPSDLLKLIRKGIDIPYGRKVNELLADFRANGVHAGFVRNSTGEIIGLITLEDILEEITGEILDEYDVGGPPKTIIPREEVG
jgi:putative hemolysin